MLCLFDLDGTLIDSERAILGGIRHALAELGQPEPANLRDWIGPPLKHSLNILFAKQPALAERALALYYARFHEVGYREHDVYPGVAAMIQSLHRDGHSLAIVTSKPHPHALRIVNDLPFGNCFTRIYGPGLGVAESQKASMIAHALRDFSTTSDDALMVGDRRYDIEGALANDVDGLGVLWGFGNQAELTQAGALALVQTPEQLLAWIGQRRIARTRRPVRGH